MTSHVIDSNTAGYIPLYAGNPSSDLFRFQPRATNPELWRTTIPLIVRVRAARHKGLIATWTAIHWLIVLYAASGRTAFGVREIAAEAGVGRNELSGPHGHIQRLVDLELLRIVGYERIPGFKEPRPVYQIDLFDLERQSLELVPDLLRERCLPPPPRPAPDPRQLDLFNELDPAPETQPEHNTSASYSAVVPQREQSMSLATPVAGQRLVPTHGNGTEQVVKKAKSTQGNLLAHESGTGAHQSRSELYESGTEAHSNEPVALEKLPETARNRDIEREKERKERESDQAPSLDSLQLIITATTRAVMQELTTQGLLRSSIDSGHVASELPLAPFSEPVLPASPLQLWQADRPSISQRDLYQLDLLAHQLDPHSNGYGAYWLGRAILLADRCLEERGQRPTIAYIQTMLRRWQQENSWGSDLESDNNDVRLTTLAGSRARSVRSRAVPEPQSELVPPETRPAVAEPQAGAEEQTAHPAVQRYCAVFGQQPNAVQAQQISQVVCDLQAWDEVLTDWQAHAWRAESVPKMLDRYASIAQPVVPQPSVPGKPDMLVIWDHPGLTNDVRQMWLRRLSYAAPKDKPKVMERFHKEHPADA